MLTRRAFTLVELLIVLAIVAILSSILLPVFVSAKAGARQVVCITNHNQVSKAHILYSADYDDRLVLAGYYFNVGEEPVYDRKWPQLVAPYTRSMALFICPEDRSERPTVDSTFDPDLVFNDADSRYYGFAERSNLGYNSMYLAPTVFVNQTKAVGQSRIGSEILSPSQTVMLVDSIWDVQGSSPVGGGIYVVVPPCRYSPVGMTAQVDTFNNGTGPIYSLKQGWVPSDSGPNELTYGGSWPWHRGKMIVSFADTSVKALSPQALTKGCNPRPSWSGFITDPSSYLWDLR